MDDFKKLPKMQAFKTGGSVKPKAMCYGGKMKKGGEVDAADIKQDKAIVKKAFAMHDKQEHHGEKTDLSKLKKGGRAKKDCGTVRKYKAGGNVTNVYEAKKSTGDKDNIRKVKDITPAKLCGGKSVKKMADGSLTGALLGAAAAPATSGVAGLLARREAEKKARAAKYLDPAQQAQLASQQAQATAAQPPNAAAQMAAPPQDIMGSATGMPAQKRGGKVKKGC
jgi:hypothetical protein